LPPGVLGAIYLTEYTRPGSPVGAAIGLGAEVLTSVPSIVFGLFGSLFLVRFMNLGMSLLAGSLTMALIILPGILRTSQQALSEVPDDLRQASLGLGAGKLRTILRVVLPSALPGILSGTILATGRITGESAALIFTAGTAVNLVPGLDQSARTLAVHMYTLAGEGLHIPQAWATALILLILVLVLNLAAAGARRAMERKMRG
ncbi:phosphate ABC transporter permease PstA, partial [uncultured Faecalibaculum sp.]